MIGLDTLVATGTVVQSDAFQKHFTDYTVSESLQFSMLSILMFLTVYLVLNKKR